MNDEQRNTVWRFAMIFIIILLGFVAVIVKIIYIQTECKNEFPHIVLYSFPEISQNYTQTR